LSAPKGTIYVNGVSVKLDSPIVLFRATNTVFQTLTFFLLISGIGQNPTEDEIEDMIDDADEDGSGSINFPEFVGLMMKKQEGTISKEEIKQVTITSKLCSL
jgi:hypothetical protein